MLRINGFKIRNFKSLTDFSIESFSSLNLFIGRNGSGKSNILEALWLFFNTFGTSLEHEFTEAIDYLWYEGEVSQPIWFHMDLILGNEECQNIFSSEVCEVLGVDSRKEIEVHITRQLEGVPAKKWRIVDLKFGNIQLVRKGESIIGKSSQTKTLNPEILNEILIALSKKFSRDFVFITAARTPILSPQSSGSRTAFIPNEVQNLIANLQKSRNRNDERRTSKLR